MLDVHARMREVRKAEAGDPIPIVAADLVENVRCLAFDEMVVNNSADAMILSRPFTALIQRGATVLAPSNRPPGDLYQDRLNRGTSLPLIALVEARLVVMGFNCRHNIPYGTKW